MPICNLRIASSSLVLAALVAAGPASAFDPKKVFKEDDNQAVILRYGMEAYRNGRKDEAASVFRYANQKKVLAGTWKLATMHAVGDGVEKDHFKAFRLFHQIADRFDTIRPTRQDLPYVSSAVTALADYYLTGIEKTPVRKNPAAAVHYYNRAAALYGYPKAQFKLGQLYLSGDLGSSQPRQAARWLKRASSKGHAGSQAILGVLYFEGKGVRRNPVHGLVLLAAAEENAKGPKQIEWIRSERLRAFGLASDKQRSEAVKRAKQMGLTLVASE
ncbi:MAG: tetratricopeptide repeat protein [Pseudomonadota bacterium]